MMQNSMATAFSWISKAKNFESKFFDLRYDRSFRKSEKEKWLENWARNYWNGKNGAWGIKSLEIKEMKEL